MGRAVRCGSVSNCGRGYRSGAIELYSGIERSLGLRRLCGIQSTLFERCKLALPQCFESFIVGEEIIIHHAAWVSEASKLQGRRILSLTSNEGLALYNIKFIAKCNL